MPEEMLPSVKFQALCDFSALPTIRDLCSGHGVGILISDVSVLPADALQGLVALPVGTSIFKGDLKKAPIAATRVMQILHSLSHQVFKNLSHALELPWERYLQEMHEFTANGQDQLQLFQQGKFTPNAWSSLTIIINLTTPSQVTVLFGEALAVFSEEITGVPDQSTVDTILLSGKQTPGKWLAYYVRPNDDVFYTRTAGALMKPLSCEEYESRKRVREMKLLGQVTMQIRVIFG